MKALVLASVLLLSSCCTPTIQYKTVPIPERYFVECDYPDFKLDENASWYDASVSLTEYSANLQAIIEKCNNAIRSIEKYNKEMNEKAGD